MDDEVSPPAKRPKLESDKFAPDPKPSTADTTVPNEASSNSPGKAVNADTVQKEAKVGISAFVNPYSKGFSGVLKQRYTDFLVNEVLSDGSVVHLESLKVPKRTVKRSASDEAAVGKAREEDSKSQDAKPADGVKSTDIADEVDSKGTAQVKDPVAKDVGKALDESKGGTDQNSEPTFELQQEDCTTLTQIFGEKLIPSMLSLHKAALKHPKRKPRDFNPVISPEIDDRELRTRAHQAVRRIFSSRLDTQTGNDSTITIRPAPLAQKPVGGGGGSDDRNDNARQSQLRGRLGWEELGGEYVHFTLYKENKDTMEAIGALCNQMKVQTKRFQIGGTKDRRAVSSQRVSVLRVHAEQLAGMNARLRGAQVGDFSYRREPVGLGWTNGNEFTISLRDCHFPLEEGLDLQQRLDLANRVLEDRVSRFREQGFINYFGLQRFGTFAASTDAIGTKMLQNDLKGAVELILDFNQEALAAAEGEDVKSTVSSDDKARAFAINMWQTTGDSRRALEKLPKKFSAEASIIRHLGFVDKKTGKKLRATDFQGALSSIPRNLRTMYVHAYQSLVWNTVATERWKKHGAQVVEGDLVFAANDRSNIPIESTGPTEVDQQGEIIIHPDAENSNNGGGDPSDDAEPHSGGRPVHAVTADEAANSRYTIFDVVLPQPGHDVAYPPNSIGKIYESFMASERGGGLDPHSMSRRWKDLSLYGSYRPLLCRPGPGMSYEVKTYTGEEEQLVETDLQRLEKKIMEEKTGQPPVVITKEESGEDDVMRDVEGKVKIAVTLSLKLGPSQYATMALRELLGEGGVISFTPDFGGGR
ncbi:MAG: hypothetical protein M1831_001032 [Alyxoria varia]|nr:MAG: hypothetical protein M1831_001032 [Alyxoria varia]